MHFRAFHGATSRNSVYRHHFAAVRVLFARSVQSVLLPDRVDWIIHKV
jgi:hypothetical protein